MSKPSSANVNCFQGINLQVSRNKRNGETASRRRQVPSVLRSAGILAVFLAFSLLSVGDLWAGDTELARLEFQVGQSQGRETTLYYGSNVAPDGAFSSNDDRFFEFGGVDYEIVIIQSGGLNAGIFQIWIKPDFPPPGEPLNQYDVHTGTLNDSGYTEHQTFNLGDRDRFVDGINAWDGTNAGWTTDNENAVVRITGPSSPITPNKDGDLRLRELDADGTVLTGCSDSGRPEIFNDPDDDGTGNWRGICDDGLTSHDVSKEEAAVICRRLGCSGGSITHDVFYGSGVSANFPQMLIDNLVCTGSENGVLDCEHAGRGEHNCFKKEIFTVSCDPPGDNSTASGLLKITGTSEVGQTLTADVSDIDDKDGLPAESTFSYQWVRVNTRLDTTDNESDIFGQTNSTYLLTDADFGKSIKLELSFTDDDGNDEEDVRSRVMGPVTVSDADAASYDGEVRLAAGDNELKGVVEIFDGKTDDGDGTGWESVCANSGWGSEEAGVVCRQLGASGNTSSAEGISLSSISPLRTFLLDSVDCDGDEDELLDCDHGTRGEHDCSSWDPEYAKVTCSSGGS